MTRDDFDAAIAAAGAGTAATIGTATAPAGGGQWHHLAHVAVLAMRGRDAAKFLQGYLTCDVLALAPDNWLHGALCNLQGRMVGNFIVCGSAEAVLMRLPAPVLEPVRQTLAKYAVFAKAKLADETAAWVGIGLMGTAAASALSELGITAPDTAGARVPLAEGELLARGDARWELWLPPAAAFAAWQRLRALLAPGDLAAWHGADIAAGLAWVQGSTSGEYLPQLLNLDRTDGVNFRKGCYLGQEIVTRLQHRGEAKRRTGRFGVPADSVEGDAVVDPAGRKVGELLLVGRAANGDPEALAVVDRSADAASLATARGPIERRNLPYALSD
jgi:hypothetical protein